MAVLDVLKHHNVGDVHSASSVCPIVIMSFEEEALEPLVGVCDLPRIFLVWKLNQLEDLRRVYT